MRKIGLIALSFLAFSVNSNAQVANFDALTFDSTGVWNGSDLSGFYEEEGFRFYNSFNTEWLSWSGFAVSDVTDNSTEGWGNQYGVSSGAAYSGANFAVATNSAKISLSSRVVDGFYITNSTYAALSMLNGDDFAKKFGGETGDDADWLKLSVIGKLDTVITDTVEFYLADYRFEDNAQDYIVTDWTWVDLNALGHVSELSFEFSSSDHGDWGMNTPAYFCMDDLTVNTVGIEEFAVEPFSIYPNPVQDRFTVNVDGVLTVYDLSGKRVKSYLVEAGNPVSMTELNSGIYIAKVGAFVEKIVKY
ncbi:MAG: DUF4465 domain-containing protein [Flavobacteriales bacterium]|nr:DUF4465 domain-containing protein [Flavobacteriales bacterium]